MVAPDRPRALVLFDASCQVCNASVRFIQRRDRSGYFEFAALDSPKGREAKRAHGIDPEREDTAFLMERGRAYERSAAVLRVLRRLDGPWRFLHLLTFVPRPLRDFAYDLFARNRRRVPGGGACGVRLEGDAAPRPAEEEPQDLEEVRP
jgi:predicted DCC family thiol-disulfide oxidoreductase YuxK